MCPAFCQCASLRVGRIRAADDPCRLARGLGALDVGVDPLACGQAGEIGRGGHGFGKMHIAFLRHIPEPRQLPQRVTVIIGADIKPRVILAAMDHQTRRLASALVPACGTAAPQAKKREATITPIAPSAGSFAISEKVIGPPHRPA